MILLLQLYARPFSAMSRILDEGRLVLALAVALAGGFLVQFMLPSAYNTTPAEAIHARAHAQAGEQTQPPASDEERPRRRSLPLPIGPFSALASIGFVFVPACILLINLWDRLGGAGVILRRDYLPVLLCAVTVWIAAIIPLAAVAGAGGLFVSDLSKRCTTSLRHSSSSTPGRCFKPICGSSAPDCDRARASAVRWSFPRSTRAMPTLTTNSASFTSSDGNRIRPPSVFARRSKLRLMRPMRFISLG